MGIFPTEGIIKPAYTFEVLKTSQVYAKAVRLFAIFRFEDKLAGFEINRFTFYKIRTAQGSFDLANAHNQLAIFFKEGQRVGIGAYTVCPYLETVINKQGIAFEFSGKKAIVLGFISIIDQ